MLLSTTKVGFVLTLSYYGSRIKTLCEGLASALVSTRMYLSANTGQPQIALLSGSIGRSQSFTESLYPRLIV